MAGGKDWTTLEQHRLTKLWVDGTKTELLLAFPGRSWNALELKARSLHLPYRKNGRPRAQDLNGLLPHEEKKLGETRALIKSTKRRIVCNQRRLAELQAERDRLVKRGHMRKIRHENLQQAQRGVDDNAGEPGLATPVISPTLRLPSDHHS